jgi:diguanylate cyclase (GGDEF)-like protein/PAS domain S-box-containing protein
MRHHLSIADKAAIYDSWFANSQDGIIITDSNQHILWLNEFAKKMCLIDATDCDDLHLSQIFTAYNAQRDFQIYETTVANNKNTDVSVSQYPIRERDPASGKVVVIRNITEHRYIEKTLLKERTRAQVALQSVHDAIIITDINGGIDYLNPMAERHTGWSDIEAHGLPITDVFSLVDVITHSPLPDPVQRCLQEGQRVHSTAQSLLRQRNGLERVIEFTVVPMGDGEGENPQVSGTLTGAVLVFRDVTDIVTMTHQMAYQATHDALTGLINRHAFETCLRQALDRAKRDNSQHVLCYLDLDQFKIVNDTCGHVAGDQLLKQLTALLCSHIRHTDILSRLGGDEFGLILQDCSIDDACAVVEELRRAIKDCRFLWEDKTFEIGVSIGVVPLVADSGDLATTLSAADSACFFAKEQGRNRIQVYQSDDKVVAQRHGEMQWVYRITRALAEERFCLYFQSIMPLLTPQVGRVHGEILLRMIDEQGQLVSPATFIPAAERYNLMPSIDRWVIRTAFKTMAQTLPEAPDKTAVVGVSINLSGQSLCDDHLLEFVIEQFRHSGIAAERVCFEITETAVIANLARAMHLITSLRELGCRFALDDFGSGLSSFAYLKRLPVDYLKIDGSFVRGMLENPIDYAIVDSINQIGHVMGILTIAEFVENAAILARLRALGVDYAQGYGIARPQPLWQAPGA